MKKIIISAFAAIFALSANAQTTSELYKFSQFDFSGITARSAAMGGAFTSLGADMSTMNINPAGIAMYRSSEVGMTFGLNIANTMTSYGNENHTRQDNVTVTLPNVGAVIAEGDGFAVGFGYTNMANFNSRMNSYGNYEQFNTKALQWADQLHGISSQQLNNIPFAGSTPLLWDAIMAYDSYLIDPAYDGASSYGLWGIIDPNDMIASRYSTTTSGTFNESSLTFGYTVNDLAYFGASIGIQSLYYNENSVYEEFSSRDSHTTGILDNFYQQHHLSINGTGVNFKVGATLRPFPWLRFGAAYHSPSWMSINESSLGDMHPYFSQGNGRVSITPELLQDYAMQTPSRLLTGASATLFGAAILSFDYELTWYNSMMYTTNINTIGWREGTLPNAIDNLPNTGAYANARGDINLNAMINDNYAPVNNYRVGLEIQPAPGFFIRGGYNYSTSPYADKPTVYANTTSMSEYGAITRYTAGLGYRTGLFNVDVAYTNTSYSSLPAVYFDYITSFNYDTGFNDTQGRPIINPAGTQLISNNNIYQHNELHNILVTLSWRF